MENWKIQLSRTYKLHVHVKGVDACRLVLLNGIPVPPLRTSSVSAPPLFIPVRTREKNFRFGGSPAVWIDPEFGVIHDRNNHESDGNCNRFPSAQFYSENILTGSEKESTRSERKSGHCEKYPDIFWTGINNNQMELPFEDRQSKLTH